MAYTEDQRQADVDTALDTQELGPAIDPFTYGPSLQRQHERRKAAERAGIPGKDLARWDLASQDAELAEAVMQMAAVAPTLRRFPSVILDTAQASVRMGQKDQALRDLRDTDLFLQIRTELDQLRALSPEAQRDRFDRMDRGLQQALQRQGYRTPADVQLAEQQQSGLLGDAFGVVQDAVSTVGRTFGVQQSVGEALDAVTGLANLASAGVRTAQYLGAERSGSSQSEGLDVLALLRNPGHTLEVYQRARHGEGLFLPHEAAAVADTFDDVEAYNLTARLAAGEDPEDLALDIAPQGIGSPEYAEALKQVQDFAGNELVVAGIRRLSGAKLSAGRQLARNMGLESGSTPFTLVSGTGDAAWTWFADPTLIAGKARKAIQFRRYGLSRFLEDGDVVARVASHYGPDAAARAARRATSDVTDPGYWRGLMAPRGSASWLNNRERAAAVISDHMAQGEMDRLVQALPGTSRLLTPLQEWNRARPIKDIDDVKAFFSDQIGMAALLSGHYANYLEDFVALPRLNRVGVGRARAKFRFEEAIDFAADAPIRLRSPIEASELVNPDPLSPARVSDSISSFTLTPMARAVRRVTRLIPKDPVLKFGSPGSNEVFRQLLDYGVGGPERRALFDTFVKAGTEAEKRAVTTDAIRSIFANMGILDDPDYKDFVDAWLRRSKQSYALDGIDHLPSADGPIPAGLWPQADTAEAIALPRFREIAAAARRNNLTGLITGVSNAEWASKFMRVWKPAVILRPAFALRAGGEEAFAQFARFGPGHIINQWILTPLAGKDTPGWIARRAGGTVQRGANLGARLGVESLADQTLLGQAIADRVAAAGNPLRQAARVLADPDEVRAYRDLAENEWVRHMYDEVGGVEIGIQGDALAGRDPFIGIPVGGIDDQRELTFRKVGSDMDVYTDDNDLKTAILTKMLGRLQHDETAKARLAVRSLFVPDEQAKRIGLVLGDSDNPRRAIADARRVLRDLSGPEARALRTAIAQRDASAMTSLVNSLARTNPAAAGMSAKLGLLSTNDAYALLVDPSKVLRGVEGLGDDVWDLVRLVEDGDDEVAARLEDTIGTARMRAPDLFDRYTRQMDRAGPLAGVVPDDVADIAITTQTRAVVERLRTREGVPPEALIRDLDELAPAVARIAPDQSALVDDLRAAYGEAQRILPGTDTTRLSRRIEVDETLLDDLLDDVAAALNGTKLDEALNNWSRLQRNALDQLFTDPEGNPLHALQVQIAEGEFDPNILRNADFRLPSRVNGPRVEPLEDERLMGSKTAARVTRWGFNKLGEQVAQMARRPLWNHNYAIASREADTLLRPLLRNDKVHDVAKGLLKDNLDDAYDVLTDTLAKLEILKIDDLPDVRLFDALGGAGITPAAHEVNADRIRRWYDNEHLIRHEVTRVAATRATANSVPFIDDHRIRSQYQEYARNLTPFWFAQEQFYKRWVRTFKHSPESLRRAQLAHHGIYAIGWLDEDEFGNEVFSYPISAFGVQVLSRVAEWLPFEGTYTLPIATAMTGELQYATPGLDDAGGLPQAGPLVALSTRMLRQLNPELGTRLESAVLTERGQGRSIPDLVVPTSVMRVWKWATADDEELAAATAGAMQMMEAAHPDSTPGPDASAAEVEEYVDRLQNHSRIILLMRAIIGATGPASPRPDLDPDDLAPEFKELLNSGLDIEEAVALFLQHHPDADAYTVFSTEVPSKAPLRPTAEVFDALTANQGFYDRYDKGSSWLLPNDAAPTEKFNRNAWTAMLASDMRVRKTSDTMYRDIKFQAAADLYFDSKDAYEDARADESLSREQKFNLDLGWNQWKDGYLATHRIFAEDLNNTNHALRVQVLDETETALADPDLPGGITHADDLRLVVEGYRAVQRTLDELNADPTTANTERGRDMKRNLKLAFRDWATARAQAHPTVKAFWSRILEPELDLPRESES